MGVIFYCVAGEGMGHATRSKAVIDHLISKKHQIVIFSFQRAYDLFVESYSKHKRVLHIQKITGLNFVYRDNEFKLLETVIRESREKLKDFFLDNFKIYSDLIIKYNPCMIVNDGEPFASNLAKILKIPLICIDNIMIIGKCVLPKKFHTKVQAALLNQNFRGDYNFILTVFNMRIKKKYAKNTELIGPFIRKEIMRQKPSIKNHVLVYQTSQSYTEMFDVLKRSKERYILYGFDKDLKEDNLTFKPSSVKEFASDLASSKGIILNGGFSLLSEAIYLGKPVYSVPVKKQIEQMINAYYIKRHGYGHASDEISVKDINYFVKNLNSYRQNIKNAGIVFNNFERIDSEIERRIKNYRITNRTKLLARITAKLGRLRKSAVSV